MPVVLSHESALRALRAYQAAAPAEGWQRAFAVRKLADLSHAVAIAEPSLADAAYRLEDIDARHLPEPVSVLVPTLTSNRSGTRVARHVCRGELPPGALWRTQDSDVLTSSPEFCFLQLASAASRSGARRAGRDASSHDVHQRLVAKLALLAMELCGTYSLGTQGAALDRRPLTSVEKIQGMMSEVPDVWKSRIAAEALGLVADNAPSPVVSALYLLLCSPRKLGGYAVGRPAVNQHLPVGVRFRQIAEAGAYAPALFWPELDLALEVDEPGFDGVARRARALATMRVRVASLTPNMLEDAELVHALATDVAALQGSRVRTPNGTFVARRTILREAVLCPLREAR